MTAPVRRSRPVRFETVVEVPDPHRCGMLTITADRDRVQIEVPDGAGFDGTPAALCELLRDADVFARAMREQETAAAERELAAWLVKLARRYVRMIERRLTLMLPPCKRCGERAGFTLPGKPP